MLVSPTQLKELYDLFTIASKSILFSLLGNAFIKKEDLDDVSKFLDKPISEDDLSFIDNAYALGMVKNSLSVGEWKELNFNQLKELASAYKLNDIEEMTLLNLKRNGLEYANGLLDSIRKDIFTKIANEETNVLDEAKAKDIIKDRLAYGKLTGKSAKAIANDLGKTFDSFDKDWLTLAYTEINAAKNKAITDNLLSERKDKNFQGTRVIVLTNPDACSECIAAYRDDDGNPKIWDLDDLLGNGTNVGVERSARQPVIPPHHPNCACELMQIPENWSFNKDGRLLPND